MMHPSAPGFVIPLWLRTKLRLILKRVLLEITVTFLPLLQNTFFGRIVP